MLGGFMLLYVELLGLIVASGYFTSILFAPAVMPETISSERCCCPRSRPIATPLLAPLPPVRRAAP